MAGRSSPPRCSSPASRWSRTAGSTMRPKVCRMRSRSCSAAAMALTPSSSTPTSSLDVGCRRVPRSPRWMRRSAAAAAASGCGERARQQQREGDAEGDVDGEGDLAGVGQRRQDARSASAPVATCAAAARIRPSTVNSGVKATASRKTSSRPRTPSASEPRDLGQAAGREDARHDHGAEQPVEQQVGGGGGEEAVDQRREDLLRRQLGRPAAEVDHGDEREDHGADQPGQEADAGDHQRRVDRPPLHERRRRLVGVAAEVADDRPQVAGRRASVADGYTSAW